MVKLSKPQLRMEKGKGKKRKLSASVPNENRSKNKSKSTEGPELIDQELGDHDFSILDTSKHNVEVTTQAEKKKKKLSNSVRESPQTLGLVKKVKKGIKTEKVITTISAELDNEAGKLVVDSVRDRPKTLGLVKKLKTEVKTEKLKTSTVKADSDNGTQIVEGKGHMTLEQVVEKYPLLGDEELVKKYLAFPLTNNQKGRLRQRFLAQFTNSENQLDADMINIGIQNALKVQPLEEKDWRRIRILHNMLRTATQSLMEPKKPKKSKKKKNKKKKEVKVKEQTGDAEVKSEDKSAEDEETEDEKVSDDEAAGSDVDKKTKSHKDKSAKVKGPKRYVVFVGNLPYDVDKDAIMRHFSDLVDRIKDVRIPKKGENKKGGMAYLELKDEPSYQMALSKHHTMFANRRINVLYTTSGKGNVDKNEAKGKTAKLLALQRSGKLLGSQPLASKRSARRKRALAAQQAADAARG